MSNATPPTIKLTSADRRLVATFFWDHDRYAHTICRMDDDLTLSSIEGFANDVSAESESPMSGISADWPCSPPIQQLSLEDINGAPVVMGVGSAGSSHWSLSVERTDSGFRFDVAARCKSSADGLGSVYRQSDQFEIAAGDGSNLLSTSKCLAISPLQIAESGTSRWDYRIS